MSLPESLDRSLTDRLAGGPTAPPAQVPPTAPQARGARRVLSRGKRFARRVVKRVLVTVAPDLLAYRNGLAVEVAALRQQVTEMVDRNAEHSTRLGMTEANRINLELLKGEVRGLEQRLRELGFAFAPATGLEGAGARFAELREQINAIERRIRYGQVGDAEGAQPTPSSPDTSDMPAPRGDATGVTSELFNYVGFERRFRGDPAEVLSAQEERYADMLAPHGPVVDIGCGRAELLQVLAGRGVEVIGVDTDGGMVAEGRARGLRIEHTDAVSFLRSAEPNSLGAIFSAHVAEHLELDVLISFIELALSRLKPGGLFVAETPNPQSLIVLGNSYILDPTHVRPLHPSLFSFLCETAGYRDVRLHFYAPATGYHLGFVDDPHAPEWVKQLNENFRRLNEVLFGPQEYAVIATKAP